CRESEWKFRLLTSAASTARCLAVAAKVVYDGCNPSGGFMATMKVVVAQMKTAQVPKPGADFEIVERAIPEPGAGQVRLKVRACGVCHSDSFTKEGSWPGIQYPRIPGHEVVGIVDAVGAGVSEWKKGGRVGVGWHGGHDNT